MNRLSRRGYIPEMGGVPDGISSTAAATVSQTVSAMLESATAAAAAASAIPRPTEEILSLDTGPIPATEVPQTGSTNVGSARTAEAKTSEEQVCHVLAPEQESTISVAAATAVPPLSLPGPAAEDTMSGVELSGRHVSGGEEGHENDAELPGEDGVPTDSANANRRSQGGLELVVLPDGGHSFFDGTTMTGNRKGEDEDHRDEGDERKELRGGGQGVEEKGEGDGSDGRKEQEEKENDICNGRVVHYGRPEDGVTVLVSGRREGAVVQVRRFSSRVGQAALRKEHRPRLLKMSRVCLLV